MNLEDRLEALARYHEDAANSVRTTLALLMNGARVTASKSLGAKLKTAIALRNGHGNGSAPPREDPSPVSRGMLPGSLSSRIVAWLAHGDPQTIASIRRHFNGHTVSIDHLVKRGLVHVVHAKRPFTYTTTEQGRAGLAQLQATPGNGGKKKAVRKKGTTKKGAVRGALLLQLREAMKDLKEKADWQEVLAAAEKKGITNLTPQTIGSAIRYGYVTATGADHHRRFTWTGA